MRAAEGDWEEVISDFGWNPGEGVVLEARYVNKVCQWKTRVAGMGVVLQCRHV